MNVITSLWGERVVIDEVEVHISVNGSVRAAIARRGDGLFCIYLHGKLSRAAMRTINAHLAAGYAESWDADTTPASLLYEDCEPEPGIYGTLDDARQEVRNRLGSAEADVP
jgi:hypothetical protein